ncbi:MAG: tetratricopeptide repeat protein [Chloroflexota bacterium]
MPKEKINWLEAAISAARELKDKNSEGVHLGNLGLAWAALGEARKAIEFYEQALEIAREIGDRRGEGSGLGNLGNALYGLGEQERGITLMKQALVIFEAIESPYAEWARKKLKGWGVK